MKQDHYPIIKLCGKWTSALKFASVQISNIKHSTVMSVIYHDKMNTIEQASLNFLMRIFIQWNILARVGQSLGWPSQPDTKSRQANERPELSWPSFPIQWALTAKSRLPPVSYDEKSCLVQTQVSWDFCLFQLTVLIRAWGLIQGKEQVHWQLKQAQELFCLRELVVSSNPRSEPETAKMPFFLKSHSKLEKSHSKLEKVTFWHFEERQPTWY